jgi:hypothetical protein
MAGGDGDVLVRAMRGGRRTPVSPGQFRRSALVLLTAALLAYLSVVLYRLARISVALPMP